MKKERTFFIKIAVALFVYILAASIWGFGAHWKLYAWIGIAICLPFIFIAPLARPLYSLWQLYVQFTSEGMRFFQGFGFVLFTVGYYLLRYMVLNGDAEQFHLLLTETRSLTDLQAAAPGNWLYWFAAGLVLFISGLIPPVANLLFKLWMGLAGLLQSIMSRVILTLVFLLAVLPIGLIAKITGKKFLDKKWEPASAGSHWIDREYTFKKENYRRHF
ncbi:MAG: hypothetical protein KDK39_15360 [Leptospiraceae bacterium]|nr:hypothetical protein [Leptospiraceae bacterium]